MEDIGEVRPEDVLEVAVGAVEEAHGGEGVLLFEGVEGDQAQLLLLLVLMLLLEELRLLLMLILE